jgi:hypothetical protein
MLFAKNRKPFVIDYQNYEIYLEFTELETSGKLVTVPVKSVKVDDENPDAIIDKLVELKLIKNTDHDRSRFFKRLFFFVMMHYQPWDLELD